MHIFKLIIADFYHCLKKDFKILTFLALPGVVAALYGFYQTGSFTPGVVIIGALQRFAVEYFFLACFLYFFHFVGLKNRWLFAFLYLGYLLINSADIALLMYFKERFGIKYFQTLEGGDYTFLTDYRVAGYLCFLIAYSVFAFKKLLKNISRPQALDSLIKSVLLLPLFAFVPFYNLLPGTGAFYAKHFVAPEPVYLALGACVKEHKPLAELTPATTFLAETYNLFTPEKEVDLPKFERIILLSTEALSSKFIRAYNPNLPEGASPTMDALSVKYPSRLLRPGALSTLYGLSIIFAGHPNAKMSYEQGYPFSFVRQLKDAGYTTTFLRGADEEYMDENILFNSAGFDNVYGAKHFSNLPQYKDSIAWWGLTDRKLFDFTADYLKEFKNKKVFIQILTVDTHVPTGREDYLGQEYSDAPSQKYYEQRNMPRAFWKHDYDLGLFIERLEKENILDDKTLLIITGDHPFYNTMTFPSLVKPYKEEFDFVPFILVSKRKIKEDLSSDAYASQSDIAPTILALTGLEKPKGMFGKHLFQNTDRTLFDIKEDYIVVKNANGQMTVPIKKAKNSHITALVDTFLKYEI